MARHLLGDGRRRVAPRIAAAVTVALAVVAGLALADPAAADLTATLSSTSFAQLAVDDVHRHVLVAGGAGSTAIEVRGFDGSLVGTVTGQQGASGLAVSPDGTSVYAALADADAVSRISLATLKETARYGLGGGVCVRTLAFAGPSLYVGYGCPSSGAIARLDLGAAPPSLGSPLPASFDRAPLLSGDSAGRVLVATDDAGSPGVVARFDLTASPPTPVFAGGGSCRDAALHPDGLQAVVACTDGAPYDHAIWATAGMTRVGAYPSGFPETSVAVLKNEAVAVGITGINATKDLWVYSRGSTTPIRSWKVGGAASRGLAFSADRTKLFAVIGSSPHFALHVVDNPVGSVTTVALTAPAASARGTALTVSGTVSGTPAFGAGARLTVTKTDLAGVHTLAAVTTDASGRFSFSDTPSVGGPNTYRATWAGSTSHLPATGSATVEVSRLATTLGLTTNHLTYSYGSTATVKAHLGTTYTGRTVVVTATPVGGKATVLANRTVDAAGNITVTKAVTRRTTFTVRFPGDARYAPRSVSRTVKVRAKVVEKLTKYYGTSGKYKLYRTSVDPVQAVLVKPNKGVQCVRWTAQVYRSGAWKTWATSSCIQLSLDSTAAARLAGSHPRNVPFRIRVRWPGDLGNVATNGAWQYVKFR